MAGPKFSCLLGLCAIVSLFLVTRQSLDTIKVGFGRAITKVVFSGEGDSLYVGGKNFLAWLAPFNLQVIFIIELGPVYDAAGCYPHPAPCDNTVTAMEYDYNYNLLLVCGTAYNGTCVLHDSQLQGYYCVNAPKHDAMANRVSAQHAGSTLVQILDAVHDPQASNSPATGDEPPALHIECRPPDYGQIGFGLSEGPYSSNEYPVGADMVKNSIRILVASWTKRNDSKDIHHTNQPIISLRQLSMAGFEFEMDFQEASSAGMHVKKNYAQGEDELETSFMASYTNGSFTYLLILQTAPCAVEKVGAGACTLALFSRLNNSDSAGIPYRETVLYCGKNHLLLSAAFAKVGSRATGDYKEIVFLIAAFGQETFSGSRKADTNVDTVICVFTLSSLNEAFTSIEELIKVGLTAGIKASPWIRNDTNTKVMDYVRSTVDVSFRGQTFDHQGRVRAIMPYTPINKSKTGTILNNKMHVYTATDTGAIHKFSLEAVTGRRGEVSPKLSTKLERVGEIDPSLSSLVPTSSGIVDNEKAVTYLAFGSEIVALNLDLCRRYQTCNLCRENSGCRWCSKMSTCIELTDIELRCQDESQNVCPPLLDDFTPKEVPVAGGSIITLRGRNLGSAAGGVHVRVCNQECVNVKPQRNTLECTVQPKCQGCPDECYLYVEVNQRESQGNTSSQDMTNNKNRQLSFVVPKMTSITPTYGPISGGNVLTVTGQHLHVGTRAFLQIMNTKCQKIPRGPDESELKCKMEKTSMARGICRPLALHIDNHVSTDNVTVYCFRQDPKITTVEPNSTLISGGLQLTVSGSSLDSVSRLRLLLKINVTRDNVTRQENFESLCHDITFFRMICTAPDMDRVRIDLANQKDSVKRLSARMVFLMESRAEVTLLTPSKHLSIFPPPNFFPVSTNSPKSFIYTKTDKLYAIEGFSIPQWLKATDIQITIGLTDCPVVKITVRYIYCNVTKVLRAYRKARREYLEGVTNATNQSTTPTTPTPTPTTTTTTTNATATNPADELVSTPSPTVFIFPPMTTSDVMADDDRRTPWELNDDPMAVTTAAQEVDLGGRDRIRSFRRRKHPVSKKDIVRITEENGKPIFHYELRVQIGHFRNSIGMVKVGPRSNEIVSPTEEPKSSELNYILIGGIAGAVVLFLAVIGITCAVRKKRRPSSRPSYMNEIGSSHPGSNESAIPTLSEILKSELEPSKRAEISNLIIAPDRLILGKEIGSGNFGCVYVATLAPKEKETPLKVAVKTLQDPVSYAINLREFVKEAVIMVGFQHSNVLGIIGLVETQMGVPYVVLPFMQNGDLLTYIRNEKRTLSLHDVIQFGADVCSGMAYLSSVKLVHRDLAARNCMLDKEYRVKVADFGLCRDIYEKGYYTSDNKKKLPIRWMAVESIERGAYSTKSDVWSMGVVLWELLSRGMTPYPGVDGWDVINFLRKRRLAPPRFCPDVLYKLMMTCWAKDPEQRPTFKTLQRELLLLIGHDAVNVPNTPEVTRSQKVAGQAKADESNSPDSDGKDGPSIQASPSTPGGEPAGKDLKEIELRRKNKSEQVPTHKSEDSMGSVMSLPRSQVVENVIISIPDCYSSRDISKKVVASYLKLVDNYEPAPRFHLPFNRSKERRNKMGARKRGSGNEEASMRSMSGKPRNSNEGKAVPHYISPDEDDAKMTSLIVSSDAPDCKPGVGARGPMASILLGQKGFSNYYELESNSPRTSCNSVLDRQSTDSSLFIDRAASVGSYLDGVGGRGNRCSSMAMSLQSIESDGDPIRPRSLYDRVSIDGRDAARGNRAHPASSWQEPTVELRPDPTTESYDRLSGEYVDSQALPEFNGLRESDNEYDRLNTEYIDSETAPEYHPLLNLRRTGQAVSRPDSSVEINNRFSDLGMERNTEYQSWEGGNAPGEVGSHEAQTCYQSWEGGNAPDEGGSHEAQTCYQSWEGGNAPDEGGSQEAQTCYQSWEGGNAPGEGGSHEAQTCYQSWEGGNAPGEGDMVTSL